MDGLGSRVSLLGKILEETSQRLRWIVASNKLQDATFRDIIKLGQLRAGEKQRAGVEI